MRCNGQRIKAVRLMKGLTLKDVSLALGVQEATVQRYESGKIKDIPDERVHALSQVLGTSVEYLMGIGDVSADDCYSDKGVDWLLKPTDLAGENIRNRRKEMHLTVDELAEKVQVSRQTIYRYEAGKLGKLSPKTKRRLADVLHTSVAYVIGKTEDPFDISPPVQTLDALTDAQIYQIDSEHQERSVLSDAVTTASKVHMETVMEICCEPDIQAKDIPDRINIVTQFIKNNEAFLKSTMSSSINDDSDRQK